MSRSTAGAHDRGIRATPGDVRGRCWIGTSGWSYAWWRGLVYPAGLAPRDWLPHLATRLASVELNATFYRLPAESALAAWRERTPPGFVFAVKAWRAITHFRRLADAGEHLRAFLERVRLLGEKLGPIVFQLPPRFAVDPPRLGAFLDSLPEAARFAFELRDPSWHRDDVYELLARHGAAFCPFELGALRSPRVATAGFVYVRLHGRKARYRGAYDARALAGWARWLEAQLAAGRDAYVYFDNTDEGDHAVRDAERLAALLSARGPVAGRPARKQSGRRGA